MRKPIDLEDRADPVTDEYWKRSALFWWAKVKELEKALDQASLDNADFQDANNAITAKVKELEAIVEDGVAVARGWLELDDEDKAEALYKKAKSFLARAGEGE